MPSDMPLPRENPTHRRPSLTDRALPTPEQSFPALASQDPRTRAALCYALPLLPALYMLWRERRNRFIRLHAAQAVVFFSGMALAQTALLVAIIPLGNWVTSAWLATVLGLLFWAAFIALGLGGLTLWLRMLNDCVHSRLRRRPLLTPLAVRLEAVSLQFTQSASAAYHARRNDAESDTRNGAE